MKYGLYDDVDEHTADHAKTGDALAVPRELTGGYGAGHACCSSTHRTLLEARRGFELDLHQHVHEENNLLFPHLVAGAGG